MKKIAAFAINRPATMIVLVAAILIMGFLNLSKLPIALMPDIDLPYAAVITSYSGAGPQEVEEQVTKVLENSVGTVSGIDTMESTSNAGSSMILLSFAYGTDMDQALLDIRDKVERARNSLPDGADSPQVMKMDPNSQPVIQLTIGSSKLSLSQIQTMVEDTIEPRLARLSDIASVNVSGGREKEIQVLVDPVKVANYGLSLSQVSSCLRSENYNESSGSVSYGQRKYFVRSLQEFEKVEDIGKAALTTAAGNKIFLRDIAQIKMTNKDRSQITRTNGIYAVGISCQKETDANTVSACKAVKEEMEKLKKELGSDLEVQVVTDQSSYIQDSINNCARMMLEGAILAALVILVFLRNIRSTLVVVTAIPLSIIATFILLYYQGSTLNIMTLGGLALGLGRMVDDSIVVFENIYRHRSLGLRPREAALTGTAQVGGAVLAGTLTLIAVFVPISQAEGIAGVLFKPFAVTICVAILCSLLVALTIVPFLSSRLLTDKAMTRSLGQGRGQRFVARMGDWLDNLGEYYKVLLQWALGNRRKVVLGVSGLTIISLCFLPLVGAEFMPSSDSGSITISLERDKGTVIEDMEKTAIQVEKLLRQNPAVDIVFTSIGSSGRLFSGSSVNEASITVQLVDKDQRRGVEEVAEEIRQSLQNVSGIKFSISIEDQMGGGSSGAINITVKGDNLETLKRISGEVANVVKNVAGTREVSSSLQDGDPEVQITINREKAADYGLTPYEVTKEIRNAIDGTVASSYRYEDDDLDVRVVNQGDSKQDLDMLKSLNINTSKGTVHLSQLATFVLDRGPVEIQRVDQVRQATISADLLNRDLNSVMTDIRKGINQLKLPAGYEIKYGGQNEQMTESFASLAMALMLAIMLVYVVMVIQYESFLDPFVIMFSIPTAIIGVIFSLLLTGRSFSVNAFIGIIMLAGIVVSNAIVFIDYLKQLRAGGMERDSAILETGRVRLRPILMTAICTILSMLPMALGIGEGGESYAPLATVVIGGLLVATFITLVLVPVVYTIFDDWNMKAKKRFLAEQGEVINNTLSQGAQAT